MADFTLDTSTLGSDIEDIKSVVEGRGRMLQLTWEQAGANQNMDIYGYAVSYGLGDDQALAEQTNAFNSANTWAYVDVPIEGNGRTISLQWEVTGANQDMDIWGYAIRYHPSEDQPGEG